MEDPFASIIDHCQYSSSQENLLNRTKFAREDEFHEDSSSPESSTPPQTPATPIYIVSPPQTPNSKNDDTSPPEDYKTPPEETTRLSSSQEQPPPPIPVTTAAAAVGAADSGIVSKLDGSDNYGSENCNEITSVAADCVEMNRNGDDLVVVSSRGFEGVRNDMIEVVNEGKVEVREISEFEFKRFHVRERVSHWMRRVIGSPSKKLKTLDGNVVVESPKSTEQLVIECKNDNGEGIVGGMDYGVHTAKRRLEFIYVINDGDLASGHGKDVDLDEIEDDDECGMVNGEISKIYNADKVQSNGGEDGEDEFHRVANWESGIADQVECNGGGGDEVEVVDGQGRRELPNSMTEPWENADCHKERGDVRSEGRKRKFNGDMGNGGTKLKGKGDMRSLLEVLRLIAEETRSHRGDNRGDVDLIEIAKRHGMTFPRPRWMARSSDDE